MNYTREYVESRGLSNYCDGSGTCGAARLHTAKAACVKCGGGSFDHQTDEADKPYCLDCGEDATELLLVLD